MTVETDDDEVRRALTPTCPSIGRRFAAMRRARALGIAVQAAVSPVLPHHRERLAGLIAEAADRAVVDTFTGDGANGRRTASRPLPARFAELGYGDWRDERAARALHEELCGSGSARSASAGPWRASTRLRSRRAQTRIVMSRMCKVSGQGACKPNSVPPSKRGRRRPSI